MTVVARTAAALLIGNELLSGKIAEANMVELAKTLRSIGVELRRVVIVPDEVSVIADEVKALSASHDVVFTSGGVGPTHDDVTLEAVALAFGVEATRHPEVEAMLRRAYGARITEGHLRMALAPAGAELAQSPEVRWPTVVMHNVWVLPGVPEAFRMKLALVRERLRGARRFVSVEVLTRLDEGELKPFLDAVVQAHPNVDVGSYPKWFDPAYKTKITFDSGDEATVEAARAQFLDLLPAGSVVDDSSSG